MEHDFNEKIRDGGWRRFATPTAIGAAILIAAIAFLAIRLFTGAIGSEEVVLESESAPSRIESVYQGEAEAQAEADDSEIVVYVTGAVRNPGVYTLAEGSRMVDAVDAAGGMAQDAATAACNLARAVADGEHIHVPTMDEASAPSANVDEDDGGALASDSLVNVNTADQALLETLPGIGPEMARRIIAERDANGPFESVDDLMRVSGIGEKKLDALRDAICV